MSDYARSGKKPDEDYGDSRMVMVCGKGFV